ncbi:hypothetical protein B0T18DRAFT_88594 [Schizothecium vesticola]|uniref:Uncharacterized protein n=1 Tax=Schizothecium vesticola TaxID=314040 RepID=A0AA40F6X0_9PEZI|nr:hypothetical protein B0T18DRAFT_88594 [Schizothecium vesticola]
MIADNSEDDGRILSRVYQELADDDMAWQGAPFMIPKDQPTTGGLKRGHQGVSKVRPLAYIPPFKIPKHLRDALTIPTEPYNAYTRDTANQDNPETLPTPQGTPDYLISDEHFLDPVQNMSRHPGGHSVGSSVTNVSPRTTPWRPHAPGTPTRASQATHDGSVLFPASLEGSHQDRHHCSKVQPAITRSDNIPWDEASRQDSCHTLHSSPAAHSRGFFPSSHSGHSIASILQPGNTNVMSSKPDSHKTARPGSGGIGVEKQGRLKGRKSATDLVAYWESRNVRPRPARSQTLAGNEAIRQPAHTLQRPAAKSSLTNLRDAYRQNSAVRKDSVESTSRRWTPSWIRGLIGMPEPYQTKLTEMPKRTAARRPDPSDVPRDHGSSATTKTVDRDFKNTVDKMEHLVNEATVLANQTANCEDKGRVNNHALVEMERNDAATHLPSVNESLPGEIEIADHEASMMPMETRKVTIRTLTKDTAIRTPIPRRPEPKHFRSMPGMHSGNIGFNIPRRSSSLLKDIPSPSEYWKASSSSRQVARPLDVRPSGWNPPTE